MKRKLICVVLIMFIVVSLVAYTVYPMLRIVSGVSMSPTLRDGQYVLVQECEDYSIGDIVVFKNLQTGGNWIKRVIGVSGDTVKIIKGTNEIYVNGKLIREDYLNELTTYENDIFIKVPKGHLFVMGDNRNHSIDSREIGCINICNVDGKVILFK